jgi:hypothetical protein
MKNIRLLFCFTFVWCLHTFVSAQEFVDGVDLTTTKAPWTMRMLGNDLDITNVQAKPDEASAYFMMASGSTKLNVSVFIEPVDKCRTAEACRDHVLNLGNPAWGKFEQLGKGKIKDFSYFEFYRPEVNGEPMKMFDMYAQYVSDGFWVDLHISKALYSKADHALFEKVVNSVVFVPRAGAKNTAFDAQHAKGQAAAASWLSIWDRKCNESYAPLSEMTRANIGETAWLGYCVRIIQDLGENRSRKPIASAYARSLPAKTDRPLAILAYHSSFATRPSVVELVALMLEKNGSWSVTNYIPR